MGIGVSGLGISSVRCCVAGLVETFKFFEGGSGWIYTEFCRIGLSDSNSKDLRREHLHIWDVDVFELAWAFNVQDFAGLCYRRVFGVWELVNRLRTGSFCAQCYGR